MPADNPYGNLFYSLPYPLTVDEGASAAFTRCVKAPVGGRALILGFTWQLRDVAASAGLEAVCFDVKPQGFDEVGQMCRAKDRRESSVQGDWTKPFPFEDNSFDVVLGDGSLNMLAEFDNTLAEVARVLKPGCNFAVAYEITSSMGIDELWALAAATGKEGYVYMATHSHECTTEIIIPDTICDPEFARRGSMPQYMAGFLEASKGLHIHIMDKARAEEKFRKHFMLHSVQYGEDDVLHSLKPVFCLQKPITLEY